jgi:ATP-dependent DNA helicase DinG
MLLDPRIQRQRYGRIFLESLPPYRLTQEITDVEQFFEKACLSYTNLSAR